MERDAGHQRADRHLRRDGGQRRHLRPHLPRALVLIEQVVAEPDRVEPALLGGDRHRPVLGPANLAFDLRKLDSDAHARARYADQRFFGPVRASTLPTRATEATMLPAPTSVSGVMSSASTSQPSAIATTGFT